jgi:hypothetical protein
MLDDREREVLAEIEHSLLSDRRLPRRLASRRPRSRDVLVTSSLVASVVFLAAAAMGLFALALPGQAVVLLGLAWWPCAVLRRRVGWSRLRTRPWAGPPR